eukprot:FR739941.1.p1 GENE.FR739941.1~~FR739941.1.p1  ORF type:complete len:124 (+),score=6.40 FR739941.1:29-373(+)
MKRGISYQTFLRYVKPLAKRLSEVISEIQFENRLARDNHHPNFPRLFTTIVDTLPVYISSPRSYAASILYYSPKYKVSGCDQQIPIHLLNQAYVVKVFICSLSCCTRHMLLKSS